MRSPRGEVQQTDDFGGQIASPIQFSGSGNCSAAAAAVCIMWVRVGVLSELYYVHSIVVGRVADVC